MQFFISLFPSHSLFSTRPKPNPYPANTPSHSSSCNQSLCDQHQMLICESYRESLNNINRCSPNFTETPLRKEHLHQEKFEHLY